MTEHRSAYQAVSGMIEEAPPDTLLLIPILQSGRASGDEPVCLHLVHLENGNLALCSARTDQRCPCCRLPMCQEHRSSLQVLFPDNDWTNEDPLCETCAALPRQIRWNLHTFVTQTNESQVQ